MKIDCIITVFKQAGQHSLAGLFTELYAEPGMQVFKLAPGIALQACTAAAQPPPYLATGMLLNIRVTDLESVITTAVAQGASILEKAFDGCTGHTFYHLRLADGQVIGFFGNA